MKIGFIGLGIMGSRMAANLLAGGVELIVHNRTKEKAATLLEQGATWAESFAAFADADIVFTMLAHPEAVEQVALGAKGLLNHLRPGKLWVDCSTVNPSFSRQMALEAKTRNIRFLEAPVAGTKPQAQNGALVFFVGGDANHLADCTPYLELMGQKVVHVGPHGMGMSLKVVINVMLATAMATFAEGMALGEALGLPQTVLFNTLLGGPVTAPFLVSKRDKMTNAAYDPEFPLQWMQKDMQMAAIAAYEAGVAMPIANITKEVYQLAMKDGLGEQDISAIYQFLTGSPR
ncbi:MAG: NAD(P)-dependent oxidoreductase [Chloroflexota bacterium]